VVLSFKQMPPVALAYGQVNDAFAGSFQAMKAHRARVKDGPAGLLFCPMLP
jgi:hypothetical protein